MNVFFRIAIDSPHMSDVCRRVDTTGQLSDSDREEILKVAKEFLEKYKAENPQNA